MEGLVQALFSWSTVHLTRQGFALSSTQSCRNLGTLGDKMRLSVCERLTFFRWAIVGMLMLPGCAHADSITYLFNVNTSSIAANPTPGDTYYLDMQFKSGNSVGSSNVYYTTATAVVSNLQTDGTLAVEDPYTTPNYYGGFDAYGDVSGILPGDVSFKVDDSNYFGEYSQPIILGNDLTFDLTLSGPGVSTPICPAAAPVGGDDCNLGQFELDFYDTEGNYLLTDDPSGVLGGININADATTTPFENPGPQGGTSPLTIEATSPSTVPEPSTLCLLSSGLLGFATLRVLNLRLSSTD